MDCKECFAICVSAEKYRYDNWAWGYFVMEFCKSCGQPFDNDQAKFCEYCGTPRAQSGGYCKNCGSPVMQHETTCQVCGVATGNGVPNQNLGFDDFTVRYGGMNYNDSNIYESNPYGETTYGMPYTGTRSRIMAGVLAIFLGCWGAHNFYLGNTKTAVTQLTLSIVGTFLTCIGIGALILAGTSIWAFIEGVMLLSRQVEYDGYGQKLIG